MYFSFLQVAIGVRDTMPAPLSDADWQALFSFCKKQALLGIGFSAVERLHEAGMVCPVSIRLKWYGYAAQLERMNGKVSAQCRALTERLERDGLRCCILKGQSNQLVYPEKLRLRRNPGDIDVWCYSERGDGYVRKYVRGLFRTIGITEMPKACYHHIEAPEFEGTEVEVHYRPGFLRSPLRNGRMQRWFVEHREECMGNRTVLGFAMMTSSVNVVYQLCHLYTHIFEGGFGLRQLMDYYFTLRLWHNDAMECEDLRQQGLWTEGLGTRVLSREEILHTLRSFGMEKFTAAVMWVLQEVYGLPLSYCLCRPDAGAGRELLEEILLGGNFGQYDTRGAALKRSGVLGHGIWKLRRGMRLVRSYPEEALAEPWFRVYHLCWRVWH